MIVSPQRRIWLYPVGESALEIVILGNANPSDISERENVAAIFVHVRKLAECHLGWERVDSLVMGVSIVGVRCTIGKLATHADVLAEAMRMFEGLDGIRWSGGDSPLGMVGTWR